MRSAHTRRPAPARVAAAAARLAAPRRRPVGAFAVLVAFTCRWPDGAFAAFIALSRRCPGGAFAASIAFARALVALLAPVRRWSDRAAFAALIALALTVGLGDLSQWSMPWLVLRTAVQALLPAVCALALAARLLNRPVPARPSHLQPATRRNAALAPPRPLTTTVHSRPASGSANNRPAAARRRPFNQRIADALNVGLPGRHRRFALRQRYAVATALNIGLPGRIVLPALLWLLVLISSAAFAPSHQTDAFGAVQRACALVLLAGCVATLVRTPARWFQLARAIAVGGLMVALVGLAQAAQVPGVETMLAFAHDGAVPVGDVPRLSSTLSHPNLAAVMLELSLPLLIAWAWTTRPRPHGSAGQTRRFALSIGLWLAVLATAAATLLTFSRMGIAALLIALGVLAAVAALRREPRLAALSLTAIAGITVLLGALLLTDSDLRRRLGAELDRSSYAAGYEVPANVAAAADAQLMIPITLTNRSADPWSAVGWQRVALGYHLLRADGSPIEFDCPALPLPRAVPAGESISLEVPIAAPRQTGEYLIEWDALREGIAWFSWRGVPMQRTQLEVTLPDSASGEPRPRIADGTAGGPLADPASGVARPGSADEAAGGPLGHPAMGEQRPGSANAQRGDGQRGNVERGDGQRGDGLAADGRPGESLLPGASTEGPAARTGATPVAVAAAALPVRLPQPGRLQFWSAAWQMFLSRPLLGVGADNFRLRFAEFSGVPLSDLSVHAHNQYLEALADTGLLGLGTLCWLLVALVREAVSHAKADGAWVWRAATLASLSAWLAHAVLDDFERFWPASVVFWLIAGLAISGRPRGRGAGDKQRTDRDHGRVLDHRGMGAHEVVEHRPMRQVVVAVVHDVDLRLLE